MTRSVANLLLLLAAALWGAAFVPQHTAMKVLSPMWFLVARFSVMLLVLAPLVMREARRSPRRLSPRAWSLMGLVGLTFVGGNVLQQTALLTTSITNAGFLTSLYILFTPFVAMALTRERPGTAVWPAAGLGLLGAWLLSGGIGGATFVLGDGLLTISAVLWALQIVLIGMVMREATDRPMLLVAAQGGLLLPLCGLWAWMHDPISWTAVASAAPEIAFAGLLSGGIGYSLQAVAQRHTQASDAAVIYSTEAPFAALLGYLLLGDRPTPEQWAGAAAIFAAVLLVQLWPSHRAVQA